jgi:hypothetical protein
VREDTFGYRMMAPSRAVLDGSSEIAPTAWNAKVQAPQPSMISQAGESAANLRSRAETSTSRPKTPPFFPEPLAASLRFLNSGNSKPTHETSYGLAYVNEIGRPSFSRKPFAFPSGTVIVRERLPTLNGNPERLVVMIKHERDFNPKANGWEFLTVSGEGLKVLKREKQGQCLKCHVSASNNDFVFPEDGRYR